MAEHTSKIVPAFDFSEAEALPLMERFKQCIARAAEHVAMSGYQDFCDFPCIPAGATEAELLDMEKRTIGQALPGEYRQFLTLCRYLKIDDGAEVGGLDHEGVYVTEKPWVSNKHRPGMEYLVFANYWRFADGDQLMFDLSEPNHPVIAYLHEHGPLFEAYAPSFSLALWRLVHETNDCEP
ncbi:SMI1/KNR4 family protein [Verrucomicrobiota bacterium sgz303538]